MGLGSVLSCLGFLIKNSWSRNGSCCCVVQQMAKSRLCPTTVCTHLTGCCLMDAAYAVGNLSNLRPMSGSYHGQSSLLFVPTVFSCLSVCIPTLWCTPYCSFAVPYPTPVSPQPPTPHHQLLTPLILDTSQYSTTVVSPQRPFVSLLTLHCSFFLSFFLSVCDSIIAQSPQLQQCPPFSRFKPRGPARPSAQSLY